MYCVVKIEMRFDICIDGKNQKTIEIHLLICYSKTAAIGEAIWLVPKYNAGKRSKKPIYIFLYIWYLFLCRTKGRGDFSVIYIFAVVYDIL